MSPEQVEQLRREITDDVARVVLGSKPPRAWWTALVGPMVMLVVFSVGWVANWSYDHAVLSDHEKRLGRIEETYIPRSEQIVREQGILALQNENQHRLEAIEGKVDQLLVHQGLSR